MSDTGIEAATAVAPPPSAGHAEPPNDAMGRGTVRGGMADWIRLFRPRQWVKNSFVLAPLLFSGLATDVGAIAASFGAAALFSLLASGIYCWNDVIDRVADRAHPRKRNRPVAARAVTPTAAGTVGTLLVVIALVGAWLISRPLGTVFLSYMLLNVLYARALKRMVILDVFAIGAFFVLRLLAGCAAIHVTPSVWLLLCSGLLSLFLGFSKRRHELLLLGENSASHRSVLSEYSAPLLDQMSMILLSVTVVSYIMYSLTSPTALSVGSEALSYSTVFVLYGVFRYLFLVHQSRGGDPTETLLTDRALLANGGLWLAYCGWVLYHPF